MHLLKMAKKGYNNLKTALLIIAVIGVILIVKGVSGHINGWNETLPSLNSSPGPHVESPSSFPMNNMIIYLGWVAVIASLMLYTVLCRKR